MWANTPGGVCPRGETEPSPALGAKGSLSRCAGMCASVHTRQLLGCSFHLLGRGPPRPTFEAVHFVLPSHPACFLLTHRVWVSPNSSQHLLQATPFKSRLHHILISWNVTLGDSPCLSPVAHLWSWTGRALPRRAGEEASHGAGRHPGSPALAQALLLCASPETLAKSLYLLGPLLALSGVVLRIPSS